MGFAVAGWLPPISGAVLQEVIDVAAVLNALRAAFPPRALTDF
jgi:cation transport ATPase